MSLTLKLTSLGIRTVAKPIGNLIKRQAREHEGFRQFCVRFAQGLHRVDARMRLGLLEDSEAITREIDRQTASAEAKRLRSQQRTATVKTEKQTAAEEEAKAKERKFIEEKVKHDEKKRERQMLKPLSESKAIDTGANFASEAFVFMIGVGLLLFENWRSRRKASNRREDVDDRLEQLEDDIQRARDERTILEEHVGSLLAELDRLRSISPPSAPPTSSPAPKGSPDVATTSSSSEPKPISGATADNATSEQNQRQQKSQSKDNSQDADKEVSSKDS